MTFNTDGGYWSSAKSSKYKRGVGWLDVMLLYVSNDQDFQDSRLSRLFSPASTILHVTLVHWVCPTRCRYTVIIVASKGSRFI